MERKLKSIVESMSGQGMTDEYARSIRVIFVEKLTKNGSPLLYTDRSLFDLKGSISQKSPILDPERKWKEITISRTVRMLVDPSIE